MTKDEWLFDEAASSGTDYASAEQAAAHEAMMDRLKDRRQEAEGLVASLKLAGSETLIDLGCGSGHVAVAAAGASRKVFAVDASAVMLDLARQRARGAGVANIEFHHAGFLTYEHKAQPADVVFTRQALHHLPDFWKQIALLRMHGMLANGGRLCLIDAAISYDPAEHDSFVTRSVARWRESGHPEVAEEIERHVRREYGTFGWVLEEMLRRAGFRIDHVEYRNGVEGEYRCTKPA